MTLAVPEDQFQDISDGNQEFLDPINEKITLDLDNDPVMSNTFQQFQADNDVFAIL